MFKIDDRYIGAICAIGAFGIWGLIPIYYKAVAHVSALEVLAHRLFWTMVLLGMILVIRKEGRRGIKDLLQWKKVAFLILTTCLISANWLGVIWAVSESRILEVSLGYFINPLVNVALGMLFLRERLNWKQMMAVGLAFFGVMNLIVAHGVFPWISLTLAFTFGLYGLVRKKTGIEAIPGHFLETLMMTPFVLFYFGLLKSKGQLGMGHIDFQTDVLLICGGAVSAVPLILFLEGTKRLWLSTVGLIQYIGPTMNFFLAVLVYDEPFTPAFQITFPLIWIALIIYSLDALFTSTHK